MKKVFSIIIILVLALGCSPEFKDNDIAIINGEHYNLDDITTVFSQDYFNKLDAEKKVQKILDFTHRIIIKKEVDAMPESERRAYEQKLVQWKHRVLLENLFEEKIINSVIRQEVLEEIYERMSKERLVFHLLLSHKNTTQAQNNRTKAAAKSLSHLLEKQLTAENFEKAVLKYSDDPSTKEKGGKLGWLKTGQMFSLFDSIAFTIPLNTISKPFETPFGYHFILVKEERPLERKSFIDEKPHIFKIAKSLYSDKIKTLSASHIDSLKNVYPLKIDELKLKLFIHLVDSISESSTFQTSNSPFRDILKTVPEELSIATINNKAIGSEWLVYYLDFYNRAVPRFSSKQDYELFIENNYLKHILLESAYYEKMDTASLFLSNLQKYEYEAAYNFYLFDKILKQNLADEKELKSYYNKNKKKLYTNGKRVQVQEILLSNKSLADSLWRLIQEGEDFSTLAGIYTERNYSKAKNGLLPFFKKGRYGKMGKIAFEMKVNEMRGPIKVLEKYSIIKLIDIKDAETEPYEKVKNKVKRQWKSKNKQKIIDEALESLRKKYKVKINETFIKTLS